MGIFGFNRTADTFGRASDADPAVNSAVGVGQPVTQEIAITVKGDTVSCSIDKKQVATFARSEVVATAKLKLADSIYGLRFAHNTDATVTDLRLQAYRQILIIIRMSPS